MTRLRTVSPDDAGLHRRRRGRGFTYVRPDGSTASAEDRERAAALVIPPAWTDVWVCRYANGHIQAVGTDDAGRRQYLYHPAWREKRDQEKFSHILEVGQRLPAARAAVTRDLGRPGMPAERALATAFRLLDLGFFRVGGESYSKANGSYGLATLLRRHVRLDGQVVVFRYAAKSGQTRDLRLDDQRTLTSLREMLRRRGGGSELLAYKDGSRWHDVTSADINVYVKERLGDDVSAKDFRTWHATVLAATELAARDSDATTRTARERAVRETVSVVADYLGNTPTVARNSYVDPHVVELFRRGSTIGLSFTADDLMAKPRVRPRVERAVLALLESD